MYIQAFPLMMGELEPSGNLNAHIIHQFTKSLRCKFISQVSDLLIFTQLYGWLYQSVIRLTLNWLLQI